MYRKFMHNEMSLLNHNYFMKPGCGMGKWILPRRYLQSHFLPIHSSIIVSAFDLSKLHSIIEDHAIAL